MIKIIYHVKPEQKEQELEWLKAQKVFPAVMDAWDWSISPPAAVSAFGVIVDNDTALAIKLRHNLDVQKNYVGR